MSAQTPRPAINYVRDSLIVLLIFLFHVLLVRNMAPHRQNVAVATFKKVTEYIFITAPIFIVGCFTRTFFFCTFNRILLEFNYNTPLKILFYFQKTNTTLKSNLIAVAQQIYLSISVKEEFVTIVYCRKRRKLFCYLLSTAYQAQSISEIKLCC